MALVNDAIGGATGAPAPGRLSGAPDPCAPPGPSRPLRVASTPGRPGSLMLAHPAAAESRPATAPADGGRVEGGAADATRLPAAGGALADALVDGGAAAAL